MNESIKARIQKLLALAKDASDEESHTAMLQARKLMLKHSIQESDLITDTIGLTKNVVNERVYRSKLLWWHRKLAKIIAKHFRCNYYRNVIDSYQAEVRFVGLEQDVEIATMVYNFARASIHYFSKVYLMRSEIKRKWKRKHQFKNDYIEGYLSGLDAKFRQQTKSESLELLVVQDAMVIQYYSSLSLTTNNISEPKKAGDKDAWNLGFRDGQRFEHGRELID